MNTEKISISLETNPLTFLGRYQETDAVRSRSEVVAQALRRLRDQEPEAQYAAAMEDWQGAETPTSGTDWPLTDWTPMRRGDIYVADLDPARAGKADKRRPVIIVSANSVNRVVDRLGAGVVTFVPITSHTVRVYDFQVLLSAADTGLTTDSKAQAEQVRSIGFSRLGEAARGQVPPAQMHQLDAALRLHLDL